MKKKELSAKTIAELRSIAKDMGLRIPRTSKKEDVISAILKAERSLRSMRIKKEVKRVTVRRVKKKKIEAVSHEIPSVRIVTEEKAKKVELHPLKDIIGIIPVNERMLYIYWELMDKTMEDYRRIYPDARFVIRLYDITQTDEQSAAPYTDIMIYRNSGGIHIDTGRSGRFYGELGVITVKGIFLKIIQSNVAILPCIREVPELREILPSFRKEPIPSS